MARIPIFPEALLSKEEIPEGMQQQETQDLLFNISVTITL